MNLITLVGEDALCCALGERLVGSYLSGWHLAVPPINKRGITHLEADLPRFQKTARKIPVLCIADTDRKCPVELIRKWLPHSTPNFLLRLAVTESESWVLADREGIAGFLGVAISKVEREPDQLLDAKRHLLQLARHSKVRMLKLEMVTPAGDKPGTGYNAHLEAFVRNNWSPEAAAANSPSLQRAIQRIQSLASQ